MGTLASRTDRTWPVLRLPSHARADARAPLPCVTRPLPLSDHSSSFRGQSGLPAFWVSLALPLAKATMTPYRAHDVPSLHPTPCHFAPETSRSEFSVVSKVPNQQQLVRDRSCRRLACLKLRRCSRQLSLLQHSVCIVREVCLPQLTASRGTEIFPRWTESLLSAPLPLTRNP